MATRPPAPQEITLTFGTRCYRARYFSPSLGRFISRDVDYLDGWNLYEGYFAQGMGMV